MKRTALSVLCMISIVCGTLEAGDIAGVRPDSEPVAVAQKVPPRVESPFSMHRLKRFERKKNGPGHRLVRMQRKHFIR